MPDYRRSPQEVARSMEAAKKRKANEVLKEQKGKIRAAQYALLVIGIIQLVFAVVMYSVWHWPFIALVIDGAIGLMFAGLYFLSREKPELAFKIGLIVYGLIQVILILADGRNLVNGILIKVIIFSTLFGGISALKRIPKSLLQKKNDELLDTPDAGSDVI